MSKIKIYTNENIHKVIAKTLCEWGYDAISTVDANMLKVSDEEQMKFAVDQKRAILTFDVPHFSQIYKEYREKGLKHYGIILSDQVGVRELLRRLRKFLNYMTAETMHNRMVYLSQWKNKT